MVPLHSEVTVIAKSDFVDKFRSIEAARTAESLVSFAICR